MPVTAGGEVLRLADTPAQAARVPEQHPVLLSGTSTRQNHNCSVRLRFVVAHL